MIKFEVVFLRVSNKRNYYFSEYVVIVCNNLRINKFVRGVLIILIFSYFNFILKESK